MLSIVEETPLLIQERVCINGISNTKGYKVIHLYLTWIRRVTLRRIVKMLTGSSRVSK